jgi:spore maturation protein CgeB
MLKERFEAQIVLWFPDAISNFRKAMFLNAKYDILFFKDLQIVKTLRNEYNLNAYYLPECCNPKYHKKVSLSKEDVAKYECDITTAGNMHTARAALFKNLGNYNVKIWGNPAPLWMDTEGLESMIQNQFVSNEVKSKAFLASKIVLNNFYPSEIQSANARLFEVAATGSFQICSHRDALSELYEIDKEIITYKTLDELFFKIDFYLNKNQLRNEIAERAYNRTIIEHTYQIRLTKLLTIVFDKNITG